MDVENDVVIQFLFGCDILYNEPQILHLQGSKKLGGPSEDTEMREHHSDSESRGWNKLRYVMNYKLAEMGREMGGGRQRD